MAENSDLEGKDHPEPQLIDTKGGAYFEREVKVERGGKLIGRDLIQIFIKVLPDSWRLWIEQTGRKHWRFFVILLTLEILLFSLYQSYQALHLIAWWILGLASLGLSGIVWNEYARWTGGKTSIGAYVAALVLFFSLLGWQSWRILNPPSFASQEFGIALAELGESGGYKRTALSRAISGQVHESLCRTLRSTFLSSTGVDPCNEPVGEPKHGDVRVIPIGIVDDSQTADDFGDRIGADLLIWGQVIVSEVTGGITIRFQILENFDQAVNPDFPFTLPLTSNSTDIFADLNEIDRQDLDEIKRVVADQSTVLTSMMLGMVAYMEKDFPVAVERLSLSLDTIEENKMLQISPEGLSLMMYYLGKANHFLGNVELGQEWLLKAKALNSREPAIPLSLAFGYRSLDWVEERDRSLEEAFDLIDIWQTENPDDIKAKYDYGIALFLQQQIEVGEQYRATDEEIYLYQDILRRDPEFYIAYINLGRSHRTREEYDEAEAQLQQAIQLAAEKGTNSASAFANLAVVYSYAGDLDSADAAFQEAIARAIYKPPYDFQYARFLEANQEDDAALQAYQNLVRDANDFDKGWATSELARFMRKIGLLDQAIAKYRVAVFENPQDPLLRTYLAETYYEAGEIENALAAYQEAVDKNEIGLYYVYLSYCRVLFLENQLDQALEICQRSLGARSVGDMEYILMARSYAAQGQCNQAYESYNQVLALEDITSPEVIIAAQDGLADLETCRETP